VPSGAAAAAAAAVAAAAYAAELVPTVNREAKAPAVTKLHFHIHCSNQFHCPGLHRKLNVTDFERCWCALHVKCPGGQF
jgi:hypothetical protein